MLFDQWPSCSLELAHRVLSFIGGCLFWLFFHNLDTEEEALNAIPEGKFISPKHASSTDRLLPEAEKGERTAA